jgi:hypothetical protein
MSRKSQKITHSKYPIFSLNLRNATMQPNALGYTVAFLSIIISIKNKKSGLSPLTFFHAASLLSSSSFFFFFICSSSSKPRRRLFFVQTQMPSMIFRPNPEHHGCPFFFIQTQTAMVTSLQHSSKNPQTSKP